MVAKEVMVANEMIETVVVVVAGLGTVIVEIKVAAEKIAVSALITETTVVELGMGLLSRQFPCSRATSESASRGMTIEAATARTVPMSIVVMSCCLQGSHVVNAIHASGTSFSQRTAAQGSEAATTR